MNNYEGLGVHNLTLLPFNNNKRTTNYNNFKSLNKYTLSRSKNPNYQKVKKKSNSIYQNTNFINQIILEKINEKKNFQKEEENKNLFLTKINSLFNEENSKETISEQKNDVKFRKKKFKYYFN